LTEHKRLVSAIIPVHNGERYLAEAINSVLTQSYASLEIIVVDDGSTDGSADVVRRFKGQVQYWPQRHSGAAQARNRGVELAVGDFLGFLDADDLWIENKVESQVAALNQDPELDMVFGYVKQFISPEVEGVVRQRIYCPENPMPGYYIGAMLIRRDGFRRVGPFAAEWKIGDFIDWYTRAKEKQLKSSILPQVVSMRRIHTSNLTLLERKKSHMEYLRILKGSLDRRRHATAARTTEDTDPTDHTNNSNKLP
jgi:glycosyltransferase involved in cell wall biosynthesis